MQSPHDGYRRIKTVTSALVALAIAGTLGGSAMAFADTHATSVAKTTPTVPNPTVSHPAESSPDGSGSTSTGPSGTSSDSSGNSLGSSQGNSSGSGTSGYGYGTAPQLSAGSGRPNAVSSGS